jgi:hypothetical protein
MSIVRTLIEEMEKGQGYGLLIREDMRKEWVIDLQSLQQMQDE